MNIRIVALTVKMKWCEVMAKFWGKIARMTRPPWEEC